MCVFFINSFEFSFENLFNLIFSCILLEFSHQFFDFYNVSCYGFTFSQIKNFFSFVHNEELIFISFYSSPSFSDTIYYFYFCKQMHRNNRCMHTLFQFEFDFLSKMLQLFKARKIVFGLLVLCVLFYTHSVEAKFKMPKIKKTSSTSSLSSNQPVQQSSSIMFTPFQSEPSTSQNLNLRSRHPLNSQFSKSSTSLHTIDLYPRSSSYQSMTSLNNFNSPVILRESDALHRQAASALNMEKTNIYHPYQKQLQQYLKRIGPIAKNIGIALGATGGSITIAKAFVADDEREKKSEDNDNNDFGNSNCTNINAKVNDTFIEKYLPIGDDI